MVGFVKVIVAAVAASLIALNVWAGTMLPSAVRPDGISASYGD